MSGAGKPIVVTPRWNRVLSAHRVVLAVLLVAIFIAAVTGVFVAVSMGQTTAAFAIALVAGGFFSAAAFC